MRKTFDNTSLLTFCAMFLVGCSSKPNLRQFHFDENAYFIAQLKGNVVRYSVVRAGDRGKSALKLESPLVLHWKETSWFVESMTPDDVSNLGGRLVVPDYISDPHNVQHGYCTVGSRYEDGGFAFEFEDNRIVSFTAHWNGDENSPFKLSIGSVKSFSFPATEEKLEEVFGPPLARKDYFAK